MYALDEWESSLCACGCGQPIAEATDKSRAFNVERHTCYARRALQITKRRDAAMAEQQKRPEGWDDGLSYFIDDSFVPEPREEAGRADA